MTKTIFYKRYYQIDKSKKALLVRQKEDTEVKETFNLSMLYRIDIELNLTLCSNYRQVFRSYYNYKILLPKEFPYPLALHFTDGSIQLLWAATEEFRNEMTTTLAAYMKNERDQLRIFTRSP